MYGKVTNDIDGKIIITRYHKNQDEKIQPQTPHNMINVYFSVKYAQQYISSVLFLT